MPSSLTPSPSLPRPRAELATSKLLERHKLPQSSQSFLIFHLVPTLLLSKYHTESLILFSSSPYSFGHLSPLQGAGQPLGLSHQPYNCLSSSSLPLSPVPRYQRIPVAWDVEEAHLLTIAFKASVILATYDPATFSLIFPCTQSVAPP